MWTTQRTGLGALAVLFAGGCSSSNAIGRVQPAVIDLYDAARPDGVMEVEIARDGRIMEVEAHVAIAALPPAVLARVREAYPNGDLTGAARVVQRGGSVWRVYVTANGQSVELLLDDAGAVLESEVALSRDQAPPAVIANAEARVPGGTFRSVELITSRGFVSFHVKIARDGATYKIVLDDAGGIHRTVREHRAEIEIPLE